MSKPLGMTPTFGIRIPSRTEDMVWDAVEEAVAAGWTPEQFWSEVAAAWGHALREEADHAASVLETGYDR